MKISIILAHPNPKSFNHAIAREAAQALKAAGHRVSLHDLYKERFDPLLPAAEFAEDVRLPPRIERFVDELSTADGLIIVHPNWWGMPPAALVGWVNRILRPGRAYRFEENDKGEGVPVGLLRAKAAIVFNTANTPAGREEKVFGDPLERIWKDGVFGLCGVRKVHREIFRVVITSTLAQRKQWLARVRTLCRQVFR